MEIIDFEAVFFEKICEFFCHFFGDGGDEDSFIFLESDSDLFQEHIDLTF